MAKRLPGKIWLFFVACLVCLPLFAFDTLGGSRGPSVTVSPVPVTSIIRGERGKVDLEFHINPGYHINSNTPSAEYLIPTALRLDAPTDIVVGKVNYPTGRLATFPFSPRQKLSVYSGTFLLSVSVIPLSTVLPGRYMVRGTLRYQACDNASCYPPKNLPVQFEVRVSKGITHHRANPAQSPHVHR